MLVKFIVFKWGTKYPAYYVNRLYNSIKKTFTGNFEFYCITDDTKDIIDEVKCLSFDDINYKQSNVFTLQKLHLFSPSNIPFEGPFVLLDLDILVLKDLNLYFNEYKFLEPRIIKNYWTPEDNINMYYHVGTCIINSSFVTWDKDQFKFLYDYYQKHKDIIEYKIHSLDKFIYYTNYENLKFHPRKIVYAYSFGAEYPDDLEPYKKRDEYSIALFNTSHNRGVELHDTRDWANEYWRNFN